MPTLRDEKSAKPEPAESNDPASKRRKTETVDQADTGIGDDQPAPPAEDRAVNEADSSAPSERGDGPTKDAGEPIDSQAVDSSANNQDASSSEGTETTDAGGEGSNNDEANQKGTAGAAVSTDALLLKALEVGANAAQVLQSDVTTQPLDQQSSTAGNEQSQSTLNQVQFATNAGSGTGQDTNTQDANQSNGESKQFDLQVSQQQVSGESNAGQNETQDARASTTPATPVRAQPEVVAPGPSLQDISAATLASSVRTGEASADTETQSTDAVKASTFDKKANSPQKLNLANELAKALLPHASGENTQAGSSESSQVQASSSTIEQASGPTVQAPEAVRVTASTAAASSTQTTLGVDATGDKGAIDQIVRVTQSSTNQQTSHVRLQLDPPELGQVRIDVKVHQGNMNLRIEADTQAAKSILESRMGELRNALQRGGIHVERFDIEVKSTHQPQTQGRQDKGSDGSEFGRQTNPQNQTQEQMHEQTSNRGGPGTPEDLRRGEYAGLEEVGINVAVDQPVLSGFDVTA